MKYDFQGIKFRDHSRIDIWKYHIFQPVHCKLIVFDTWVIDLLTYGGSNYFGFLRIHITEPRLYLFKISDEMMRLSENFRQG